MNENSTLPAAPGQPVGCQRRTIILGVVVLLLVIATGAAWEFSARRALFYYGIRTDKVGLVRIMLMAGADPNFSQSGQPPLEAAMERRDQSLAMVRLLLEFHADPNRMGWDGKTALESVNSLAMVRLLLEFHADPNRMGWDGKTALESVNGPDALAMVDALLAAGASIKACSHAGTLLHQPWPNGYAEFFLSRGADINQVCEKGGPTPLHSIVGIPDLVTLYLEHGAKIVTDGSQNMTPLHKVASLKYDEKDPWHSTHLTSAIILIAHGADVNAVCFSGMTPLDYAYKSGNKEIAEYLLKHGGKSLKYNSFEEAAAADAAAHATENEYQDLLMFPEGRSDGPSCSLSLHGENRNIMEEGPNWSIVKGTVGVVRVNCHTPGYFHYAVLGMGPPVPKRFNMRLMGGIPGSEKITFDQKWVNGVMHWYYSREPITNLVEALKKGTATHFAVRNVTVGE